MANELLPCPFCGSSVLASAGLYSIHCQRCGAEGPDADTHDREAVHAAWNRRAKPAQQDAPTDEQAAFTEWAEREYRNADEYTARDYRIGLEAWKGRSKYAPAQDAERDGDGLTLEQQYEDACIAANANARDAERYRTLCETRPTLLLTGFFGNGCINRTLEDVNAILDARAQRADKGTS